jgi:membrane protease YdiL (CAAX protease family)
MTTDVRRLGGFVLGATAAVAVAIATGGMVVGLAGGLAPQRAAALVSALMCGLLIVLSAAMLRREGVRLVALGLPGSGRRWRELSAGFAVTAVIFAGVAWVQSAIVGADWQFEGPAGVRAALSALPLVGAMVCAEELLFRGVGLRYLRNACGDRTAIAMTAVAFGVYHLAGSGYWGIGAFFQFLMPCLGGVLFAWAAIRSNGLSLPIGLHLGGNWVQASVAGFHVGPAAGAVDAVWRIPITTSDVHVITAPDVAVRLPYLAALALAAVVTWVLLTLERGERRMITT